MELKIPENILYREDEIQYCLIKANKNLADYNLSEFKWFREYQEGLIRYVEEVFKAVAIGLALKLNVDPTNITKSVRIPLDTLMKAANGEELDDDHDELFYKSIFQALKDKFKVFEKFYKKFGFNNGRPLTPLQFKGKILYDPTVKRAMTRQEWKQIEDDIVEFLGNKIGNLEDEVIVRSALLGKLVQTMEADGISIDKQKDMTWNNVESKYKVPENTDEANRYYGISTDEEHAIEYAQQHAAEHLAVNGKLKTKIVNLVRKQIAGGIEDEITAQEMVSRLFWIDPKDELGARYDNDTIESVNRDWRRVAITESSYAFSNGYINAIDAKNEKEKKPSYFVYSGRVNPQEHPNRPCNSFLGVIVKKVKKPLSNDEINDKYAKYAIWSGKNNIGRDAKNYWVSIPTHPHCTHYWEEIDPETEEWDESIGKIVFKIDKSFDDDNLSLIKANTEKNKVLVFDVGLGVELADKLQKDNEVKYYTCWNADEGPRFRMFAPGLGIIKKEYGFFDYIDWANTILFTYVGNGDLVNYLREKGKAVFGAGKGEKLETERVKSLEIMKALNINYPKTQVIKGFEKLKLFLEKNENKFVKFDKFRGDVETFYANKYDENLKLKLTELEIGFGPFVNDVRFIVQEKVEGVEVGFDLIFDGNNFCSPYLYGYEHKRTGSYIGRFTNKLPQPLSILASRIKPYLAEKDYRGAISVECIVDKKGQYHVIDWTCRFPFPLSVLYTEAISNYSQMINSVANKNNIKLDIYSDYVVALALTSEMLTDKWRQIDFNKKYSDRIKFVMNCKKNGLNWIIPGYNGPQALILGFDNNLEKAIQKVKFTIEDSKICGDLLKWNQSIFDDVLKTIDEGKKSKVEF